VTILDKLAEHDHMPMPAIGYGIFSMVVFVAMLLALVAIGRGRPDRR